jgi:hypothetical protein
MLLPLITICSLLIAATFAGVAWRVLRDEQRRGEARIAALGAAMDGVVDTATAWTPSRAAATEGALRLFDSERPPGFRRAPLTTLAIGVAAAVVVVVAIAMTSGRARAPEPVDAAAPATTAAADSAAGHAPLELVSMQSARAGDALTVTGLVRNTDATPAHGLIAVVFAFDDAGHFVSSARAPIGVVTLGPDDESSFRVTVPNAAGARRYRVSFRTEAGVVRHLDRRGSTQVSTN